MISVADSFEKQLQKAADFLISYPEDKIIRIVSHHDADGICAASILISALNNLGRKYSTTIVPQLDDLTIKNLANESHNFFIFTDLGSSNISTLSKVMRDKDIIILDHHKPGKEQQETSDAGEDTKRYNGKSNGKSNGKRDSDNGTGNKEFDATIVHVNPHNHGINGSKDISGSGVVYLFCEYIDSTNSSMSHLAVIGAIGDCQERDGFCGYNDAILKKAAKSNRIKIEQGLKIFGAQSKHLLRLLVQCIDPIIPGVSGNEKGTLALLKELGIKPKKNNRWKMLSDLTEEEIKRLTAKIVGLLDNKEKKNILGKIYMIPGQEGSFCDAREVSTILNSCGRLDKPAIGIGACLGDEKMKEKALETLHEYKREILDMLRWFKENKDTENILDTKKYIIINTTDNIKPSMAGTFASIISFSGETEKGKFIMTMSRNGDDTTKISLRMSGGTYGKDVNLQKIMARTARHTKGQAGGHKNAAGALIDTKDEALFIDAAKKIFEQTALEERIY